MGSSQCFFSWSIAFNSSMVFVGITSTVMTPPCKVFTFTSRGMVAMAARKPSTRNRQRLRCVSKMWVALKSTAPLQKCTIYNTCRGSLTLRHHYFGTRNIANSFIFPDSSVFELNNCSKTGKKYFLPGTISPLLKPLKKKNLECCRVGWSWPVGLFCLRSRWASRAETTGMVYRQWQQT